MFEGRLLNKFLIKSEGRVGREDRRSAFGFVRGSQFVDSYTNGRGENQESADQINSLDALFEEEKIGQEPEDDNHIANDGYKACGVGLEGDRH